jgi:peptide deformylase
VSGVLEILRYPDPRLKEISEPVERFDDALRALLAALEETLRAGPATVGLAAPQTGHLLRVAIVDVSGRKQRSKQAATETCHGRMVLVNPEIVEWDGLAIGREGCLSVPDFTGNVIRAERIVLEAFDEGGSRSRRELAGFEARAVQHEVDHLDGVLFLDRLVSRRSDLFRRKQYQPPPPPPSGEEPADR